MPRRCCVPECKSNYDSTLKQCNNKCETTFAFPKCPKRVKEWLKAIPRKNWTSTKSSVVCAKHFCDSDIIRHHEFTTASGETKKVPLKYPKLVETAIPRKFEQLPKYLSSEAAKKRLDPEDRHQSFLHREEILIENFIQADCISNFNDFMENFRTKINLDTWEVKASDGKLYFYILNIDGLLTITRTILIDQDMRIKVYLKDKELSSNDLKWILSRDLKLERWSQLSNLLSHYKSANTNIQERSIIDMLNQGLEIISKAYLKCEEDDTFVYSKQLEIIIDQLHQMVSSKHRYKPVTIIMSFILYCQSPSCYNIIRDFFGRVLQVICQYHQLMQIVTKLI